MRSVRVCVPLVALALAATACSTIGESSGSEEPEDGATPTEVVLVTHESFVLPKKLVKQFEEESGFDLEVRAAGDAGVLTNKLVLTQDNPLGDVAFGVDNTFASRALAEGVFAPYDATLPEGAEQYLLPGDGEDGEARALTPVDNASVCVNVDDTWFAEQDLAAPTSLDDLVDPAYEGLFVTPGAATSSPGMAFLLATIGAYGEDGWQDYWSELMDNDTLLTDGWSDAYQVDFTQGGGKGDRPIVLSYDSSPAFTIADDGTSTTSALLDTCFRQVEYAGVLEGAANPAGAEALVDFLLSPDVQAALPESMYVFPVDASVELPAEWAEFAEQPTEPITVDPEAIAEGRDDWLRDWSDITSR
ncbi:thiamine ABC transporter substrate binding subunit [Nocardioides sp. SR21]|uniref:thiamine ABC transporter substrate-binding protein n=1 Tax=Nocardioides sp. SR21 TaxID=2919501 RepID=UPI001FAA9187|nr:thiamine ABC transporter substrate-binding protein [Nocardioides sp. SR21]